MKYIVIALLFSWNGFSQATIFTQDGRKTHIIEQSFKVIPKNKRVLYQTSDAVQMKAKYKEIDSAIVGNFKFKVLKVGKKRLGLYELANADEKQLFGISSIKSRPAGGFERPYKHFEVIIVDKVSEKIIYKNTFSDDDSAKAKQQRIAVLKAIKDNFRKCNVVLERIAAIEAALENEDRAIEDFIKVPLNLLCD